MNGTCYMTELQSSIRRNHSPSCYRDAPQTLLILSSLNYSVLALSSQKKTHLTGIYADLGLSGVSVLLHGT